MSQAKESIYQVFRPQPGAPPELKTIYKSRQPPADAVLNALIPKFEDWEDEALGYYVAALGRHGTISHGFRPVFNVQRWLRQNECMPWNVVERSSLAIEWLYRKGVLTLVRTYLWVPPELDPPTPFILDCSPLATIDEMLVDFEKRYWARPTLTAYSRADFR